MSFLNAASDLSPFSEIVPSAISLDKPTKSSIVTSRRRVKVVPQTGPNLGASGANGGSQQVQFLVADQGGLLDPRSIVLNYTIQTSGAATPCPDDGHVFTTAQLLINGQLLDNIQQAAKVTNIEMKMGGSKSFYQSAGSFMGFQLLNADLNAAVPSSTDSTSIGAWGYVAGNQASAAVRSARAADVRTGNTAGMQVSIPLGLISGFGRCAQYVPLSVLGELAIVLQSGTAANVLFSTSSDTTGDFSLSKISLEYDIVVPSAGYMSMLQKVAMEDGGFMIPYESTIVGTGGVISSSSSALQESTIIVSRATNYLLRASVIQQPVTGGTTLGFPSQSCFSHAGTNSFQFKIGSQVYPQLPAEQDAAMFTTSLAAYGSPMNENGSVVNRALWGQSTNAGTAGTPATYETAQVASGGSVKFCYADSFIPSYGFQTIKGGAEPSLLDAVSLSGASGSQLVATIISAPSTSYTPYVSLVATRLLTAGNGAVSVKGA
jgi:hypothetical protein